MNSTTNTATANTLTLHFGPTADLTINEDAVAPERIQRAFALVCPTTWGRADWKEKIHAVLHPKDLAAADVTPADVVEAVAFYTATPCESHESEIHAEPGTFAHIFKAAGYRMGPAY